MSDEDDERIYTLEEAAEHLLRNLVKSSTLRNAITRGELAHTRLGRRIFVTKQDIEEWRARCRVAATRTSIHRQADPPPIGEPTTVASSGATDALQMALDRLKNTPPPKRGARPKRP